MRFLKTVRALAIGLALALGVSQIGEAQTTTSGVVFFANYDVTTAGYTYGFFGNRAAMPYDQPFGDGVSVDQRNNRVKTTGSSTTVAAVDTSNGEPFAGVAAGDLLIFPRSLASATANTDFVRFPAYRYITAKASNDSLTVDTAIILDPSVVPSTVPIAATAAYFPFRYKNFISGTGATDGWFDVRSFVGINVDFQVNTINATSLEATLECKADINAATANPIFVGSFTAAGHKAVAVDFRAVHYDLCRVGWKVTADGGAQVVYTFVWPLLRAQGN